MVELGCAGVDRVQHQRASSWGWTGEVGHTGVERDGAGLIVCTLSRSIEAPRVVRTEAVTRKSIGGSGRYGASTYPFDRGKGGTLVPIRRYDGPGTAWIMTEENERDRKNSDSRDSSSNSSSICSYSERLDGI